MEREGGWPEGGAGSHVFELPSGGGEPAAAMAEAVAWLADADPAELPPLGTAVDVDRLSATYEGRAAGTADPSLAFEYGGCLVTVEPGRFAVERAATTASSAPEAVPD